MTDKQIINGKNLEDGKPGNMFKFLGKTDPKRAMNLELVKEWISGWALKEKQK